MTELKKIDKNATVKQSNNLTIARYTLSLMEQRLMFAICSQIDKNASDFEKIRFSVNDLADLCNIKGNRKYDDIKKVSVKLLKRIVTIPTADGGEYITHWLQSQRYYTSDSSIEFKIDSDLKGELLQLKKAYVNTSISMLTSFKKKYSSRMYLIMKKMLKIGEFEYPLEFFRETFQLADTYKKFSNIKNGVLEPALAEINEKSDINVKWDYIKEGRSYTKIHFVVSAKREIKKAIAAAPTETKNEPTDADEEKELLARLTNPKKWNLTSTRAEQIINKYGVDHVRKNLLYADKYRAGKANLGGWLVNCIRNDYAADEQSRKAEQERERLKQRERDESKFKPIVPTPPTETETKNKRTGNAGALAWLAKNQV